MSADRMKAVKLTISTHDVQELREACKVIEGFPPLVEFDERLVSLALGCVQSLLVRDPITAAIWLSDDLEAIERFEAQVAAELTTESTKGTEV